MAQRGRSVNTGHKARGSERDRASGESTNQNTDLTRDNSTLECFQSTIIHRTNTANEEKHKRGKQEATPRNKHDNNTPTLCSWPQV